MPEASQASRAEEGKTNASPVGLFRNMSLTTASSKPPSSISVQTRK